MTPLLVMMLLVLSPGPRRGGMGGSGNHAIRHHHGLCGPGLIRRTEQMAKMWHVIDFTTVQEYLGVAVFSVRAQGRCDCADERTRTLAETGFSGQMAGGAVVYTFPDAGRWHPVAPQTIARTLFQLACGTP